MGTTESAHIGIETDAPDRSWEHVGCFELGDRRATLEKFLLPDRDMTLTVRYLPPTTEGRFLLSTLRTKLLTMRWSIF